MLLIDLEHRRKSQTQPIFCSTHIFLQQKCWKKNLKNYRRSLGSTKLWIRLLLLLSFKTILPFRPGISQNTGMQDISGHVLNVLVIQDDIFLVQSISIVNI